MRVHWRTWAMTLVLTLAVSVGAAAQPITLTYMHTDENLGFLRLIELFNEAHDHIKVELRPNTGLDNAIPVEVAAGVGPDLFFVHPNNLVAWGRAGLLEDLTPYVERDADVLAPDLYFPFALESAMVDGRYFAWPYGLVEAGRILYNADIFERAGMTPPDESWDWEQWKAVADRLSIDRDGDGVNDQYGSNVMNHREVYHYILSAGGRLYSEDLTEYLPDRAETVAAIEFAASIVREGITNRQVGGGQWYNGDVAMFFHHFPGAVSSLTRVQNDSIFTPGTAVQPKHANGDRRILFHSNMFGINPNSPNKEAAWEFIRWAVGPEGFARAAHEAFGVSQLLPPRSDVAMSPYFTEVDPSRGPTSLNPGLSIQIVSEWGVPEVVPTGHNRVYGMFTDGLKAVENGDMPPETFYESVVRSINVMLADAR